MTAPRAIWLGLATLAAAWAAALGVPIVLTVEAFACAVVPPLIGTFMRGSTSPERVAEIESVLWIGLATMGVASTGGAGSPLIVLFAVGVAAAWAAGELRLILEAAAFSLLGLIFGAFASASGSWMDTGDAQAIGMAYGSCGLALLGVMAVMAASRQPAKTSGPQASAPMKPVSGSNPDPETALRIKQLEAKARTLEVAEQAERKEIADVNARLEARTTFFAQTSHELRTPLNAIVGFAEMMRNAVFGPLPERYQEYAGLIHEGGRNLSLIVDDVLDLARVEAGRYEIVRDIVSLTDLAAEAVHF